MARRTWYPLAIASLALVISSPISTQPSSLAAGAALDGLTLIDGRATVTTAGTPVALGSDQVVFSITITALESNAGTIVIGGDTVVAALATRRGRPLAPGDSISLSGDPQMAGMWWSLARVKMDAVNSGDGATYAAAVRN